MTVKRVKNQLIQLVVGVSISMSAVVANAAIQPPEMDNTAYVLMDYNTGEILAQKNANEALPPASLTKMMTSYIIEQRLASGDLKEDEQVLMSPNAWCRGSSSQSCMYVPVNKTASVIDMLRGIIIQSGNDASKAMAEHIAGSEASFAILMNEQAQKIGMENSNFVNATGMPDEGHLASALDLSKLARAIIKNSGDYYSIYAEKEFTYNGITQGNRNALLITDPTVDGLKTGHTDAAGYCLVASSNREGMRLISVIMGTKSQQARADQSRELLNWGFGHFTTVTKAPAGQFVSKLPVWFGEADEVELATGDNLQILTSKTQKNKITTVVDIPESLEAPIKKGQEVGKMMAVIDGKAVASVPIIATNDIEQSGFMSRTWEHIVRWVKNLL
ncbi:D-alanyl-D-alanine carboxypeptidase [Psychrobacter nivimaris]|jgi:D-alanyl-D-alanine carboxypeptidase (penicillin-binding protein 5/6)|uniref:serine-type D-Ala-D-Ala carboxypeptidase n=1 Tax=Psychrobacter nivimaris TaxID=281738 RepID=A0A6N7BZN6_9GAMM|nr:MULTISPECIES: D-alanyl-D-alanine carboxypeptidase family protein [Psychrobacter]KAF0569084.1 D-alanyl-D-alanine carboxypeptidase [Psychrobacter nivimaris]MDN3447697.1 D-alanyl-D-alanine carboxypeptidase family protein [Psychrobacter sp. APC 3281]PKH65575.1 serine-type D-Ala-D-Ala carboxypeptidase [Psychrobacter sp. 4Dc]